MTPTRLIKLNPEAIDYRAIYEAAVVLEKGGLVAFPTETVYGVAANLLNKAAVERLKLIKERPQNKQFSIHVGDKADADKYAVNILPRAYKVMDKFWPGPLTIILSAANDSSVGLRMPKNEIALRLLRLADFPVIAPSANRAGHPPTCDADSVLREFDGEVEIILDGGPTALKVESTVLDARKLPFVVLREGFLKKEDVLKVAGQKTILFVCTGNSCRSVMAEYLLKKKMADVARFDVESLSAGTFAFLGMGPTHETQKLIEEIGLDASGHHAKRINSDILNISDFIFTMEKRHKDDIIRHFPQVKSRVYILGEFVKLDPADIEMQDPIGKSEEFYRMIFARIKDAVEKLEIPK